MRTRTTFNSSSTKRTTFDGHHSIKSNKPSKKIKHSSEQKTHTRQFSNDELFSIFRFLSPQSILYPCCAVCKQWNQLAFSNILWKHYCSTLLMNDLFKWNKKCTLFKVELESQTSNDENEVVASENDPQYWYSIFRTVFYFPMFQSFNSFTEQDFDNDQQDSDGEYVESEICRSEECLTFQMPPTFISDFECELQEPSDYYKNELEQVYKKRSLQAKQAILLTILGRRECMPNVWTDKVFISKCDHRHVVLESCAIPLAAFLVSITFQEYDTLKTLVDFSTHNHQLAVSPFVSDKVQPFAYFQVMDDYLDDLEFDTENFEWTDRDFGKGGEWIPKFFNAGAYAEEYSYRASFIDESREWKVTKVYNSYYV